MPASFKNIEWEQREEEAAASEAARIGGRARYEDVEPAQRPLVEAGEGVAEGFELAEEELIEAAEHTDHECDPLADAFTPEVGVGKALGEYADADHEDTSELPGADR
jgi:hypothetical protein